MRTHQSMLCPVSMISLLGQRHIKHHLHPKKGLASHRNELPTAGLWHPFQVATLFTHSLIQVPHQNQRHSLERGAAGRMEALYRPGFVHLCIPHPKVHNAEGTNMNLYLESSFYYTCLHPFCLPYTWQSVSKSTWTELEQNWIGRKLPAEKLPLLRSPPLYLQGKMLCVPCSVLSQLLLDASV